MNTVNAFDLVDNAIIMDLSQSFRCSEAIAKDIQTFGQYYFGKSFKFRGTNQDYSEDDSEVYLSRANSSLIEDIIRLNALGKPYRLARDVDEIFKAPIAINDALHGISIDDKDYKFLNTEFKNCTKDKSYNGDFLKYLETVHSDDAEIIAAIDLLKKINKSSKDIRTIKAETKKYSAPFTKTNHSNIILSTAHMFKGMEARVVNLNIDLTENIIRKQREFNACRDLKRNEPVKAALKKNKLEYVQAEQDYKESLNLFYVGMSRAKETLNNVLIYPLHTKTK